MQRIPPTETKGRKQTSMISVAVLEIPLDMRDILLPKSELKIEYKVGTGPGGQHRNRTASAVRMVHIPTNASVVIDGRNQHQNKKEAYRILSAKVYQTYMQKRLDNINKKRKQQMQGGNRGNKIRTYNFVKGRVVNHLNGKKTSNVKAIMKGELEKIL